MDMTGLQRAAYVPITNRRRALTIVIVAGLYLAVMLALLTFRQRISRPVADAAPITVTLLPSPEPTQPTPRRDPAIAKPRAQSPKPAIAPVPLPTVPVTVAAPLASPPPAATGPIKAGEGDAVYDLDNGGGGGGAGFVPPHWVHKVTDDEFFPLVDEDLMRQSLEVDYRMQCTIALDTRVQCRVLREVPFYPGLRRAVLAAVPMLRMAPGKRDGRAIDDQRVEFLWRIVVDHGGVTLR